MVVCLNCSSVTIRPEHDKGATYTDARNERLCGCGVSWDTRTSEIRPSGHGQARFNPRNGLDYPPRPHTHKLWTGTVHACRWHPCPPFTVPSCVLCQYDPRLSPTLSPSRQSSPGPPACSTIRPRGAWAGRFLLPLSSCPKATRNPRVRPCPRRCNSLFRMLLPVNSDSTTTAASSTQRMRPFTRLSPRV